MRPTRPQALFLAALLLLPLAAAQGADQETVALEPVGGEERPSALEPRLPESLFPERLRNPGLRQGDHWVGYDQEIGGGARFDIGDGAARIRVDEASREGSAFIVQHVPIAPGESFDFRVRARDDGGIQRYAFILREVGEDGSVNDTLYFAPPTYGETRAFAFRWEPASHSARELIVHLRVALAEGAQADVAFSQPSLRPAATYAWQVDGVETPGADLLLDLRQVPDGEHLVQVRATGPGGATVEGQRAVELRSRPAIVDLRAPSLVLAGDVVTLRAGGSRAPDADDLLPPWNVSLEKGLWRLDASEIGGRATLSHEQEPDGTPVAVIRVEDAQARGSVALLHEAPLVEAPGARELLVRHRDDGGILGYAHIVRHVLDAGERPRLDDALEESGPTDVWSWSRLAWEPGGDPGVRFAVLLRFFVEEGADAEVRFSEASLKTAVELHWTLPGGETTTGHEASFRTTQPDIDEVQLEVRALEQTTTLTRSVAAVAEAPLACTGDSGAHLLWRPGVDLRGMPLRLVDANGTQLLEAQGPAEGLVLPLGSNENATVAAQLMARGDTRGLHVQQAASDARGIVSTTAPGEARVGQPVDYLVRTCGESLDRVTLMAGGREHDLEARDVGGGYHAATFTPRLADALRTFDAGDGTAQVRVVLVDDLVLKIAVAFLALGAAAWTWRRRPA